MSTAKEYHDDATQHGNYQYVPLSEIIDGLLVEANDDDSYLKNTKRSTLLYYAKQGIKKLNRAVANEVLAVEITVRSNLSLTLPQDFVDYIRVSVVSEDFKLLPLKINHTANLATGYLQDHNNEILFAQDGSILTADASNAYNKPLKRYELSIDECKGGRFNADTSKASKNGEFVIDYRRGKILFDSELAEKEIVLEYVSDGLNWEYIDETEVTIHKNIEEPLRDWVYYACIAQRRNVSEVEKNRALNAFKATRHRAKHAIAKFKMVDIAKALDAGSMWN